MRDEEELHVRVSAERVLTLPELYQEYENSHRIQAGLPFEEKIKALIDLQKLAVSWGNRRDVIVWRTS